MGPVANDHAWAEHDLAWRSPEDVVAGWPNASRIDRHLLRGKTRGPWWDLLEGLNATLLITREYEHFVLALSAPRGRPRVSYLPLPHPSGLVVDRNRHEVHIASTRNPSQILTLAPAGLSPDQQSAPNVLVPIRARWFPGSLYLHDLAFIDGNLHANAVGENTVIRIGEIQGHRQVWWPASVDGPGGPQTDRNYLQLNSIAAGPGLDSSFFTASAEAPSSRRPGHRNFPVTGRGVVFSGHTRMAALRGLTRPHSARLHAERLWIDNSGFGDLVVQRDSAFETVTRLRGWTRGLCFLERYAFVGTSRVIPRFERYAPGLSRDESICGVHAVDTQTGKVDASIEWRAGNQVFAIDWIESSVASGLVFTPNGRRAARDTLFRFGLNHQTRDGQSRPRRKAKL